VVKLGQNTGHFTWSPTWVFSLLWAVAHKIFVERRNDLSKRYTREKEIHLSSPLRWIALHWPFWSGITKQILAEALFDGDRSHAICRGQAWWTENCLSSEVVCWSGPAAALRFIQLIFEPVRRLPEQEFVEWLAFDRLRSPRQLIVNLDKTLCATDSGIYHTYTKFWRKCDHENRWTIRRLQMCSCRKRVKWFKSDSYWFRKL
jgi:hypothetical protein